MQVEPRRSPIVKQAVEGKGYVVVENNFEALNTDIDSAAELKATVYAFAEKADFIPIFHHALLSDRGYPLTYVQPEEIGLESKRKQAIVPRPLITNSTKTLVDSSPESKIHRFVESWVNVNINEHSDVKYDVEGIAVILSPVDTEEQTRHHDLAAYSDTDLMKNPNLSIIISVDERGSLVGWEYSHHAVHASHKAQTTLVQNSMLLSKIRKNVPASVDVDNLRKSEIFFGTNEVMVILDNFVHGGAVNHMRKALLRVHAYIGHKGSNTQTKYTHIPSEAIWDLTRPGAKSKDFFIKDTDYKFDYSDDEDSRDPITQAVNNKQSLTGTSVASVNNSSGRGPGRPPNKKKRT
jgi:hypothetical protein